VSQKEKAKDPWLDIPTGEIDAGASQESPAEPGVSRERIIAHLRFLLENRGLLLRTFLIALAASTAIAFLIPARYDATTQLMPPDSDSLSGMALPLGAAAARTGGLGAVASDLLGAKNSGALFVGILESRTVQDRLIGEFRLDRVYRQSKIEDARQALLDHSYIAEDRKSGIIAITVRDHDPRRAASISQAYAAELDRLVAQVSTSSARRERIFLEERLTAVKKDLDNAAQKFSEFASKNTAIDIPAQGKAMVEAAATLQGQLIAAESELRGLQAIYADQNVRVRSIRARVSELREQLGKMGGDSDVSGALSVNSDPSLYPSIRQLPRLGVTYADLYRRTRIQETVFELLTQQYELAKVQEAKEIPSVKILDAATVPTKKAFPPRLVIATGGTALAMAAVCVWLFARRHWLSMDPQDPGKQFAGEVAGALRLDAGKLAPAGVAIARAMGKGRKVFESARQEAQQPPEEGAPAASKLT
jgi:uncharacterized protein involved in exopolysaccharide biosynthesis